MVDERRLAADEIDDPILVVRHRGDQDDPHPERLEPPREPRRVRVRDVAAHEFVANREQGRDHPASMPVVFRESTDADAPAIAGLVAEANPHLVVTAASILHRRTTTPSRERRRTLVAEVDDAVVGYGDAGLDSRAARTTAGFCRVVVATDRRRRGIGRELLARAEAHLRKLGAEAWTSMIFETEAALAFAARHGFQVERIAFASAVDPRTVDAAPPRGVELVSAAELGPEPFFAVDVAAAADEPTAEPPAPMPYGEWFDDVWRNPTFTAGGSFAAVVGGEAVSIALLYAAPELGRGFNAFAATRPEFRGRGLALAAKAARSGRAAANGITRVSTANDSENAPMLAINRRLGYRPLGRLVTLRSTSAETDASRAQQGPAP